MDRYKIKDKRPAQSATKQLWQLERMEPLLQQIVQIHALVMQNLELLRGGMVQHGTVAFFIQVRNLNRIIMSNIFTTVFLKFISEIVFIFIALRTQSNKERNGVIMRANLEKRGR